MKLNLISGKDMCKILEMVGFTKIHQVGSHVRYVHPQGYRTVVPVHGNELLGKGLLNEILKQAHISRDEYEQLRQKI